MRTAAPLRGGAAPLAAAAALALGACGGSGDDPLSDSLSYFPGETALVAVIATDLDGEAVRRFDRLGSRLPGWERLKSSIQDRLDDQRGISFDEDIRPQLGNPLVVGLDPVTGGTRVALAVRDPEALREDVERQESKGSVNRLDDYKGAAVFASTRRGDGAVSALHGDVLVLADTEEQVRAAIDTSENAESLAADDELESSLDELGDDALFRFFSDVQKGLEAGDRERARQIRSVAWLKALGVVRARMEAKGDALELDVTAETNRTELEADDLPLGSGPDPPALHDPRAPLAVGLREPVRLVRFAESVARAVDPEGFRGYETALQQLRSTLGVDIHDDLLGGISGLSVSLDSRPAATFRGELRDPEGFAEALDRVPLFVQGFLSGALGGDFSVQQQGDGSDAVYVVTLNGDEVARYAVRDGLLVGSVLAGDLPRARRGKPATGSDGALSVRLRPGRLDPQDLGIGGPAASPELRRVLDRLGPLTIDGRAEPGVVTLEASLEIE